MIAPPKYTVRKADGEILSPGTYFVIRATDLFASAGLWAYINCLETVLELSTERPALTVPEQRHLRLVADQAAELATQWQQLVPRLPD